MIIGCTNKTTTDKHELPELIEVPIKTTPSKLISKELIRIEAKVTQGQEVVKDADEMKFELWKEGQPENRHEKLSGTLDEEKGVYYKKMFEEPGNYKIIAHVTARDMHNMPNVQLEVSE